MIAPLWLCLHLPHLGLEVFTRGLPDEQAATPRVLVEPSQPGSSKLLVTQSNPAATAAGIRAGTSLATARSICPELQHVERQPPLEAIRLRELAEHLYGWSHQVSFAPPATLILEIGRSLRLFGPLQTLCNTLVRILATLGHNTNPGLGHTPAAATVLAQQAQPIPAVAPDQAQVLAQLRQTPLNMAGFEPKQVAAFQAMGLHQLGQVLDLPSKPLGRRFGNSLLRTLEQLTGTRPDPWPLITPRPRFSSSLHLLEDLTNTQALLFPMQRLLGELHHWLTRRQLRTSSIHWQLLHPSHNTQELTLNTAQPTLARKQLLELTKLRLDRGDLLPEVASLCLLVPATALSSVAATDNSSTSKTDLFDRPSNNADPNTLLDLFKARLGDDVCSAVQLQDDHRPEHGFRLAPARVFPARHSSGSNQYGVQQHTNKRHKPTPGTIPTAQSRHPQRTGTRAPRPLWLLRQPKPIPAHNLTLLQGPERIDVGWWQAATPRDYFVARRKVGASSASDANSLCWVFQCPDTGRWFLHGLFA